LCSSSWQLGLKALDEERKQWKSVYSLHHDRGAKHGAKQEPYWIVIAKATFAALFACCGLVHFLYLTIFRAFPRGGLVGSVPLLPQAVADSKPD
jgi:hypothetical protein